MNTKDIIKFLQRGNVSVEDITEEQLRVLTKYWKLDHDN